MCTHFIWLNVLLKLKQNSSEKKTLAFCYCNPMPYNNKLKFEMGQ